MKGLLIKDFYLTKKIFINTAIVTIIMFVFLFLLKTATKVGNLSDLGIDSKLFNNFSLSFVIVPTMILLNIPCSAQILDKKSKTTKTICCAPISHKKLVQSRFLELILVTLFSILITLLFLFACHIANIMDFTWNNVLLVLLTTLFTFMYVSFAIFLNSIFKNSDVAGLISSAFLIFLVLVIVLIGYLSTGFFGKEMVMQIWKSIKEHKIIYILTAVAFCIIISSISYYLNTKIVREEE